MALLDDYKQDSMFSDQVPTLSKRPVGAPPPPSLTAGTGAVAKPPVNPVTPAANATGATDPNPGAPSAAGTGNPFDVDLSKSFGNGQSAADIAATTAQTSNVVNKQARTGGNTNFDPAAPLPTVFNPTGPSLLNPTAPTFTPSLDFKPNAAVPVPAAAVSTATPAANDAAPAGATSLAGRPLGYGQVINGVPTFSDGSGTGKIPRTMSDQQITDLGNRINTVPDAAIAHPPPGVAFSEASGGKYTPTVGDPLLARPIAAAPVDSATAVAQAESNARSDVSSILNEDPRSALGIAARNARISLGGLKGARTSRYGGGQTPYEGAIASLITRAQQPVTDAQQTAIATQREAGETARENTRAGATIQDALSRRPDPKQYQLADGTTGERGADGRVHTVLDAAGNPVHEQVGKPAIDQAAYGKILEQNISRMAGIDPITGMVKGADGKMRQPSQQELQDATEKARAITNSAFGINAEKADEKAGTGAAAAGAPNDQQITFLKQNPALRAQFDAKFGQGASKKILGS